MLLDVWTIDGSSFHFGRQGMDQEVSGVHLPSDSLFAALTARLAALDGPQAVENWSQPFMTPTPPFVLSSAFPRAGQVRFFPAPLRTAPAKKPEEQRAPYKHLKKVRFVSEPVFLSLVRGASLADLYDERNCLQDGEALISTEELRNLPEELRRLPDAERKNGRVWTVAQRPRVAIGREAQNSNLFFTGQTLFAEGCGLWFGVQWTADQPEWKQTLARLLADLGDAGLGGERSSGFGQAKIERSGELALPDAAGQPWVTLSRYLPHPQDTPALLDQRAAYSIETAGGWVESPGKPAERRRALHMLAEGSVFGRLERAVPGQMADVQPDYGDKRPLGHPVWRNGQAIAVGFTPGALEVNGYGRI